MTAAQSRTAHHSAELEELRARLAEAEETLSAIRTGEVDALIIAGPEGDVVYTLRGAQRPYRLMVEEMREGAITVDSLGTILYCNRRFAEMVGTPLERVIGAPLEPFVAPRDARVLDALLAAARQGRTNGTQGEVALVAGPAGGEVPVQVGISNLPSEDATDLCILIATDLTVQKRNQELVAAERLARSILDSAAEAILVCDPESRVVRANRAAEDLFGRGLVGRVIDEAWPAPADEAESVLAAVRAGEQRRGIEARLVRPDGGSFELTAAVAPLSGADGAFAGSVVTLVDLTEQKRTEVLLREQAAELRQSNADLDSFAHIASHDLKESLRGITLYSGFLLEDYGATLDEPARARLESICRLSRRLDAQLAALLEYSRLGQTELAVEETDLGHVLAEVIDGHRAAIEQAGATVRVSTHLPTVRCDRVRVAEVFANLVINAIKYNDRVVKDVEIGALPAESAAGPPVIYIKDNGIGIDPKHQEIIFQVFKRLHPRDVYGGGTGSGLAIAKKIVERHHGRLWVRSEPGQGSTFFFTLAPDAPPPDHA